MPSPSHQTRQMPHWDPSPLAECRGDTIPKTFFSASCPEVRLSLPATVQYPNFRPPLLVSGVECVDRNHDLGPRARRGISAPHAEIVASHLERDYNVRSAADVSQGGDAEMGARYGICWDRERIVLEACAGFGGGKCRILGGPGDVVALDTFVARLEYEIIGVA